MVSILSSTHTAKFVWGMLAAGLTLAHSDSLSTSKSAPLNLVATSTCDLSQNLRSPLIKDFYCNEERHQLSLLANVTRDSLKGHQVSLIANIATERVHGMQLAHALNYAREVNTQIAWNVNLAHRVHKLQFGSFNIADTVHGAQFGFVNISKQVDGTALGLITLSKNGLLHLDASSDITGMAHLTFASGHRYYSAFDFGYTIDDDSHPYSIGIGLGRHWQAGAGYIESELFIHMLGNEHTTDSQWSHHEDHGSMNDKGINHLLQAKIRLGQPLFAHTGIFAGLTLNALVHGDNQPMVHPWTNTFTYSNDEALFWPGIEIGFRFGR